jgi:hypothetical protein
MHPRRYTEANLGQNYGLLILDTSVLIEFQEYATHRMKEEPRYLE